MTRNAKTGLAALLLLATWACALASDHGTAMTRSATKLIGWPTGWQNGKIGRPTIPYSLGVNIHFTKPKPGEIKMLAAAGFKWVRMDFAWAQIEKRRGHYDFRPWDTLLKALTRYHLRALWILDYGNPLYQHGQLPTTPAARKAFCRWVAAAMAHFKGHGIMWEMWNESEISPAAYARLAVDVGKTIRRVAPHELYVGPALLCTYVHDPKLAYLKGILQGGVLHYFNAVTVHPYRIFVGLRRPETVRTDYRRIRQLIRHYAPAGKNVPIISSEWGCYTTPGAYGDGGARYAAREFLVDLYENIPVSIWYDWWDHSNSFGLIDVTNGPDGKNLLKPKPAYHAIQTLSRELNNCRFVRRMKVGNKNDYVLLFRGPQGDRIAAWKIGAKPKTVRLRIKPGHYRIINELGKKTRLVVVPRSDQTLTLTISHAPEYLVPKAKR